MEGIAAAGPSIGIDAAFQYSGSAAQFLSGTIFYVVIMRIFSTTGVGTIALFSAIIGLFNIIFTFGLGTAAKHFISYGIGVGDYGSVKRIIEKILFIGILFSSLGIIIILFFAPLISEIFLHSESYAKLVEVLSVAFVGNTMFGLVNSVLLGIQKFRICAIVGVLSWGIYYFGAIVLSLYLESIEMIIFGWALGMFTGLAIEISIIMRFVKGHASKGFAPSTRVLFGYSVPVVLSGVVSYGSTSVDRFIVSGIMNISSLGVYSLALLVVSSISFLAAPFANILVPRLSEKFGRNGKASIQPTVTLAVSLLSYIYVPGAIGIASLAPVVLRLLGGPAYVPGAFALQIILFFSALFVTENILASTIASIRKTRVLLYATATALCGNILISLLLIPRIGLAGAALGYSSVYVATFSIQFLFARREGVIQIDMVGLGKIWISSGIMLLSIESLLMLVGPSLLFVPLYVGVGIIVYVLISKIIRPFSSESARAVIYFFPSKFKRIRRIVTFLLSSRESEARLGKELQQRI